MTVYIICERFIKNMIQKSALDNNVCFVKHLCINGASVTRIRKTKLAKDTIFYMLNADRKL